MVDREPLPAIQLDQTGWLCRIVRVMALNETDEVQVDHFIQTRNLPKNKIYMQISFLYFFIADQSISKKNLGLSTLCKIRMHIGDRTILLQQLCALRRAFRPALVQELGQRSFG
jgi:hypothetical protein